MTMTGSAFLHFTTENDEGPHAIRRQAKIVAPCTSEMVFTLDKFSTRELLLFRSLGQ